MSELAVAIDPKRDHIRGPLDAPVTLVEYADYECPHCRAVAPVIDELLSRSDGQVRFVMRHLPLTDVHPYAALAAEAAEAAAAQGRFWEMHDLLFAGAEPQLHTNDIVRKAWDLGLDVERFEDDLRTGRYAARVSRDVASAEAAGVAGTPTFFIDERRYRGGHDLASLEAAIRAAAERARPDHGPVPDGEAA